MKVIIYQNDRGGVAVCYPTGEEPIESVKIKATPTHSIIVNIDHLPETEWDFFDCWEMKDGVNVTVNLEKAKEQTRRRLREERAPLLAALDVEFQRALEISADTQKIVAEKQRLRDLTDLVDSCKSTEELRKLKVGA